MRYKRVRKPGCCGGGCFSLVPMTADEERRYAEVDSRIRIVVGIAGWVFAAVVGAAGFWLMAR